MALLVLPGCGYRLKQTLTEAFQSPRGVFIPVFTNFTEETGAERTFTNAVIRELTSRGDVTVSSRESGGLELLGRIDSITYAPSIYTATGFEGLQPYRRLPTELALAVTITCTLIETRTGRQLWTGKFSASQKVEAPIQRTRGFQGASSIGLQTLSLVESRYGDVARMLARDVYDNIVAVF